MLTYYHGTDETSAQSIIKNGADITKGGGELGNGFYIGSSLWRAYSWAWQRAQQKTSANSKVGYSVIEYNLDESDFLKLDILCLNRNSTMERFVDLKKNNLLCQWQSDHDAIWAPLVGCNIQDAYQIKFESQIGENYINNQKTRIL